MEQNGGGVYGRVWGKEGEEENVVIILISKIEILKPPMHFQLQQKCKNIDTYLQLMSENIS